MCSKDIYLSFFYGAKIGIIGLNGSGKSTVLKIIAGLRNLIKEKWYSRPAIRWDTWRKNRILMNPKFVKEVVMEGVQPIVDALAEYEEINLKFGLPRIL